MKSLKGLIETLESKAEVDGVFLTGSHGLGLAHANSDIDLIVILKENTQNIRSVFEMIDDTFADIFFFDTRELTDIIRYEKANGSSSNGMLLSWLQKGDIKFDKSGLLKQLKAKLPEIKLIISEHEKTVFLDKISYNLLANKRYFSSTDPIYKEALEVRLMYSIPDLFVGFLVLRDQPWRGEKDAIKFVKENDPKFYELFLEYQKTTDLERKMSLYSRMAEKAISKGMKPFDYRKPVCLSKGDNTPEEVAKLQNFWDQITR